MLSVRHVNKYFRDEEKARILDLFVDPPKDLLFHSVKDVTLRVRKGEVFGVLGPNGCGKSTLIRMITTLVTPDSGSIRIGGIDAVKEPDRVKDIIGRVSVDASFFRKLSPLENLSYAAGLYGLSPKESREDARSILLELGFPEEKHTLPFERLSRGQQQKVAIARGFLARPKLLLLDEPTTGLDPVSKIDVQRFVRRIIHEYGVTIVITSHDMEEIDKLCDRLLIMDEGKVIAQGTSEDLKSHQRIGTLYDLQTDDHERTQEIIQGIEGVSNLRRVTDDKRQEHLYIEIGDIGCAAVTITQSLREHGIRLHSLGQVRPTLEDVFVKLTGKTLEGENDGTG